MAFDVQSLVELARCGDCLSQAQKENVALYLLSQIVDTGGSGGGLHNLLSLTHPDTVPGPPLRGSLIVGNATPDWEALLIGAANRVLRSDGVDATWAQLALGTDVTGVLPIANGGTNSSAALNNNRIMVSSGGAIVEAAALTNGQLLIGSTGAAPVAAGLTAGANITITPGAGSVTIAATAITHTVLDATVHTDTVTQAVTRGSLIYGNATPKWDELVIGAAGTFLGSDGADVSWTVLPGSFSGFANPTAQVGLVAVNGVATTAMRSDAAPALSQAIAPTWTGTHIFSPTTANAIQLNPFGVAAGNTSEIRFLELAASGTNYTGFKAADTMAASEIYVLPDAAPSANRFLRAGAVAAGVSTLTWAQISLTADVTGILPVANGGTGTSTAFTLGSVIFAGAAGVFSQDNANFFWDDTNNRLGIGTAAPSVTFHVSKALAGALTNTIFENTNAASGDQMRVQFLRGQDTGVGITKGMVLFSYGPNNSTGGSGWADYESRPLQFWTGASAAATEKMRLSVAGGLSLGASVLATDPGAGSMRIQNTLTLTSVVTIGQAALAVGPFGVAAGNTGEVRFLELAAGGTNYAGFKASDAMAASEIYVLPNAAPAANRFLQAAAVAGGVSSLSWAQVSLTADVTGILSVANGGSGTSTAFTAGSVIFAGTAGVYAQDNANFFWDDTNNWLGLGIAVPLARLHVVSSAAAHIASIIRASAAQSANLTEWQNSSAVANTAINAAGNISIPLTTSTVGIIFQEAERFIHAFGTANFFAGNMSGNFTLTGTGNTGMGKDTLKVLTTGTGNTAVGYQALIANTTGGQNMAVGNNALLSNTTGSNNTAVGSSAMQFNVAAIDNTVIGFNALNGFNTGGENCAIGAYALTVNTSGASNVSIGRSSLGSNSTGSFNISIGRAALASNTTGSSNIAIGRNSLVTSGTTSNSVAIGESAGVSATGANNVLIGHQAGDNLSTGANNIVLGYALDSPTATNSNTLTIGNLIFGAGVDGTGTALSGGGVGIRVITPTARLHLCAGTTAASTAPLKFNTGTSMTAAEAGAVEFTTDDLFFTITTGAARKRLIMADATAGLTSGKMPIATTNGRLIDLTASAAYTPTNVTTDRDFNADLTSVDELADLVGTLIADLQSKGILG